MYIDIDSLRKDLKDDCCGAYFAGGFGGAMMEYYDIDRMSDSELLSYAKRKGVDLSKYKR